MSRWGKPIKNKKRIDPRYFLNENSGMSRENLLAMLKAATLKNRKDAQELVWEYAEEFQQNRIKFNPYSEEKMSIDRESVAKAFNLDPQTGKRKEDNKAASDMASKLQQQNPDKEISMDGDKAEKTPQATPGVDVQKGEASNDNYVGNLKTMLMNIDMVSKGLESDGKLNSKMVEEVSRYSKELVSIFTNWYKDHGNVRKEYDEKMFTGTMEKLENLLDRLDARA